MSEEAGINVAGLPYPLRLLNQAESVRLIDDRSLSMRAGARTDWFIDPDGGPAVGNAPALLMPVTGSWMLSAVVAAEHASTFDAAVLVVRQAARTWAKVCLERSPQGDVMVVSVVTRDASDDCNSIPIDGSSVHLRISRLERAYAFHYSIEGTYWNLVRYFSLGPGGEAEVGFLAQSPTGDGCTAEFRHIRFTPGKLTDLRSGA